MFGSGSIGYRWAVKMLKVAARRKVSSATDVLLPLEILELHSARGQREKGMRISRATLRLLDEVTDLTEADFLAAWELQRKYPSQSPRLLSRIAGMKRAGIETICTTYASGMDEITEVNRSNLIDLVDE
jgi:hypothetical protein